MPDYNRMTPARHQAPNIGVPRHLNLRGLRFMAAGEGGDPTPTPPAAPPAPQGDPEDKPLGPGGEKALHAEREARKALEQTVAQMQQAQQEQMAAIAAAFGVKPDAKDTDGSQLLSTLQQQVADMQREALVFRIANAHQITEGDDIELLKSANDEDTMTKLAARLAAKAAETPGTPKPDLSQGGTGDTPKPDLGPGMPRLQAAYASTSK